VIVASTVFLVVALVTFVVGLFSDGAAMFAVSMGSSVLAGITLFFGVRQGRRAEPVPATLGPPMEQIPDDLFAPYGAQMQPTQETPAPGFEESSFEPEPESYTDIDRPGDEESLMFGEEPEAAPPVVDADYLAERAKKAAPKPSAPRRPAAKPTAAKAAAAKAAASKSTASKTAVAKKPAAKSPAKAAPKTPPKPTKSAASKPAAKSSTSKASASKSSAAKPSASKSAAAKKPAAKTTASKTAAAKKPAAKKPAPKKK
jgi:hypothetical protein